MKGFSIFVRKQVVNKIYLTAILTTLLLLFVLWMIWGNVTVGVTHYYLTSDKLLDTFDGFKIVVVSDLHNTCFGSDNSQLTRKIEEEHPDIIAITGDLVDSYRTDMETAVALLHNLVQIAPCYYVTGNHEERIGSRFSELEEMLIAENVQILRDQVICFEKNGQMIQIAGLDDPAFSEWENDLKQNIIKAKLNYMDLSDDYCILLSHRPEMFDAYVEENIDMVISGHAHGGQFRLPFIGGIIAPDQGFFPKYDAGKYIQDNTTMIVSRGIGNSIISVRFNNRPEIVAVELNAVS